ncbi:MAG: hypothetical protein EBQ67_03720 [Sphingobacteriia bacterium]|nr:hypothetical protein [Sphingobacteriia bacterium]
MNASGTVNASDALVISRRYANVIGSFSSGNWVFDTAVLSLNGSAVSRNLQGLCYGDVNGSFFPGAARWGSPSFELLEDAEWTWKQSLNHQNAPIVTTIRSNYSGKVGALSLDLSWPAFLGEPRVRFLLGNQEPVVSWLDGRLRLAWNDVQGWDLEDHDPVFEIEHTPVGNLAPWSWELGPGTEWADPLGQPLVRAGLRLPASLRGVSQGPFNSCELWPNPAQGPFRIVTSAEILDSWQAAAGNKICIGSSRPNRQGRASFTLGFQPTSTQRIRIGSGLASRWALHGGASGHCRRLCPQRASNSLELIHWTVNLSSQFRNN